MAYVFRAWKDGFLSRPQHIVGRSCESLPHAIRMAKPGDTILLREGTHRVASTLVLSVPLRILGPAFDTRVAGTLPGAARTRGIIRPDTIDSDTSETPGRETCIIIGHSGVDPVIDLRKTAVVRGLRIVSKRGCCIHHRGGSALIEG